MSKKKSSIKKTASVEPTQPLTALENYGNSKKYTKVFLTLLLALICLILYANTLKHGYAYDDKMMITENDITQKGFNGISEHLRHSFLYGYMHQEGYDAGSSHWRPLAMASFAIDIGIWGPDKPGNSHVVNLLIYIFIVILLFKLLHKHVLKDTWLAFFSALFFAIHPIHTEVVANIKGRDELLCLLMLLISFRFLFKFITNNNFVQYLVSLVFFFLSLCTKENGLTFLAGIPLLLYFSTDLKRKPIAIYSGGFIVAAILFMVIRNSIVPLSLSGMSDDITNNPYLFATGTEAISTKIYVLLLYLKLAVFPNPLTHDYSYNHLPYVHAGNPWVWVSILLYVSMFFYAVKKSTSKSVLSFAILMFFITLSISTNIVIETGVMMAERMLFIPSIFVGIILAKLGQKILVFATNKYHWNLRIATVLLCIPLFLAASIKTINRNKDWENDTTLNLSDVKRSPESARINYGAGSVFYTLGEDSTSTKNRRDSSFLVAIKYFKKAISIYPDYNDAWVSLSLTYTMVDSLSKAEQCLITARTNDPNHPRLLGVEEYVARLFFNKALIYSRANSFDSAIFYYDKSNKYIKAPDPLWFQSMNNIANAYYNKNEFEKAKEALTEIKNIDPNYPNVQKSLIALELLLEQEKTSQK